MLHSHKRSILLLLACGVFSNTLCARAGTTGSITGLVVSTTKAPVAGVTIVAVSASQTATVTTDAAGRFGFLSLAPDTYTITVSKTGFETSSLTGVSVFADQLQTIRVTLAPSLRTIAHVTARSSMDLVKSGTTSDVYSVNSTVTQAAAGLGGGGNLNNAYSAIASVPGTFVPPNQQGWDQIVYIRGGDYDQVGYEFDGVPVNRSFDNYPGSTAGTLGQQELQVYAGGGTAGESTSGLAGFINQVIKTGTYPGYATVSGGIGSTTYYHSLQVRGWRRDARPALLLLRRHRRLQSRLPLSRSVQRLESRRRLGLSGHRLQHGKPLLRRRLSDVRLHSAERIRVTTTDRTRRQSGIRSRLTLGNGVRPTTSTERRGNDPGCYATITPAYSAYGVSNLADRENVLNLHFGIPHRHDAGRDDVQVLYNVVALQTQFYSSQDDLGPNVITELSQYEFGPSYRVPEVWPDFVTWPSGTHFGESASGLSPVPYFAPSSPGNRCANIDPYGYYPTFHIAGQCATGTYSAVPPDNRDSFWNNASIFKLQYQHNMGSNAYFRIYGYTFYSDWLQASALSYGTPFYGFGALSYDYELESHTRGLSFTFADQLSSQHLLTFDANYVTATTNRYNNNNFNNYPGTSATNLTNGTECFAYYTGSVYKGGQVYHQGQPAPCNSLLTSGSFIDPEPGPTVPGASWQVTYTGNSGFLNTVTPNFTAVALQDQWNPTDKLNINLGLREEIV